jgi:hypothetical protein
MTRLIDSPFLMLVLSFLILWACAWVGAKILGRYAAGGEDAREDLRHRAGGVLDTSGPDYWLQLLHGRQSLRSAPARRGCRSGSDAAVTAQLVTAIAFFLIADIDSPAGGGVIHVTPQNLLAQGKLRR